MKLMNILSCEEYQDIISWMPDGKGFMVQKPKAFVSHILPLHFKEVKFSSFTRKVGYLQSFHFSKFFNFSPYN